MSDAANTISTHVLDTGLGRPAAGIYVVLERIDDDGVADPVGSGTTDANGRIPDLLASGGAIDAGTYQLRFATRPYFEAADRDSFFPEVTVCFRVARGAQHYHVPLLLSPYGFTTYRGS